MAKFRKKPVVIEAIQWFPSLAWSSVNSDFALALQRVAFVHESKLIIRTLEGEVTAQSGDWIIRGVAGEFYPCKPEIFTATYDDVHEEWCEYPHLLGQTPCVKMVSGGPVDG